MNFINNWSQPVTLASGATSLALGLPDGSYRLTLTDSLSAPSTWEVVSAEVSSGSATVTRGLEGTIDQNWPAGSVIYCAVTAGVLAEMAARIATLEQGGGGGEAITKENYRTLVPSGYLGSAAGNGAGGLQLFNRQDVGCLFYGSIANYLAMAPVYEAGIGPRTNFGLYPSWALGAAMCSYVYTVTGSGSRAFIGLAPPSGEIGELRLAASSFGGAGTEIPAVDFQLGLSLVVPTLASGDSLTVVFRIAGLSSAILEFDPVTRGWSAAGIQLGTQGEYLTHLDIYPGPLNASGYPASAMVDVGEGQVEIDLSPDSSAELSGIFVSASTAAGSVIQIGRIGGHVTYGVYA